MSNVRWLPILAALPLLSCSTPQVDSRLLPRDDGSVTVVSMAREESPAAASNVAEANRYCEMQDRKAVFGVEETEYQGVLMFPRGTNVARVIKNLPLLGSQVTSDEDFRVTTTFKCV